MSSTAVQPRTTDLGDGIVLHANGLEIERDLSFNEWKELVERLDLTTDRALWSSGDAWAWGVERFGKEYHDAIAQLAEGSRLRLLAGRVATAIPLPRRRGQLSFDMHELVAPLDEVEQETQLDEAERQGWTRYQLQFELAAGKGERSPAPALSPVRGPLYQLCAIAAAKPSTTVTIELPGEVEPDEWKTLVLERAARAQGATLVEAA